MLSFLIVNVMHVWGQDLTAAVRNQVSFYLIDWNMASLVACDLHTFSSSAMALYIAYLTF
jgi:hypothetical protein